MGTEMIRPRFISRAPQPLFTPDANTVLWLPGQDDANSSTIRDRSGFGNDGTITSATWTQDSKGIRYLDFDGDNDLIAVTGTSDLDLFGKSAVTIEAWINARSDGGGDTGRIAQKEPNNAMLFFVMGQAGGAVKLSALLNRATTNSDATTTATLTINAWHQVVMVCTIASGLVFYIDGSVAAAGADLGDGAFVDDSAGDLSIGNDTAAAGRTFDGGIWGYRRHNRDIGASVVAGHFRQERGLFGV